MVSHSVALFATGGAAKAGAGAASSAREGSPTYNPKNRSASLGDLAGLRMTSLARPHTHTDGSNHDHVKKKARSRANSDDEVRIVSFRDYVTASVIIPPWLLLAS